MFETLRNALRSRISAKIILYIHDADRCALRLTASSAGRRQDIFLGVVRKSDR